MLRADDNDTVDEVGSAEESKEENEVVQAYRLYVTEVMSAMVFFADPGINLAKTLPVIQKAANTAVRISKVIYDVSF